MNAIYYTIGAFAAVLESCRLMRARNVVWRIASRRGAGWDGFDHVADALSGTR